MKTLRDYIVTVEYIEWGVWQTRVLTVREYNAKEARAAARRAGWRVFSVRRAWS